MISINDPLIDQMLAEIKTQKPTKPAILEQEQKEDQTPCKHEKPLCDCLECLYIDLFPKTFYQFGKAFYIKFSEPLVLHEKRIITDELRDLRKKELNRSGRSLTSKSICGFVDAFIWYLDHTIEDYPGPSMVNVLEYLFNIVFNIPEKIVLTSNEEFYLERQRKHVYECQVRDIAHKIDYDLSRKLKTGDF